MKIGFIGCGNMGGAILQGILQGGTPAADIYVADHNLETLRQRLGHTDVQICRSNTEVAALCDAVFLAVKPNVLSAVLAEIGPVLAERTALPLLISIAAGKSTAYLEEQLTVPCPVVRVMPNINALVGEAVSAVCAGKNATADQAKTVCDLMACTGKVLELEETMFPLFGVLGGCSPAFVYMFIDALARAGVKHGMRKDQALQIATQSVLGSAKMIAESNEHPWELVDRVCSPGGTTIEGVLSLKADGLETAVQNAVDAAVEKDSKL